MTHSLTTSSQEPVNATAQTKTGLQMRLDYGQPSQVHADHVALFAQLNRSEVAFHANVKQPLLFRDCLLALFDIVSSDYRYVPKDRSAYTAFMQMKRNSANANLFSAQRAYFDWVFNNDPLAYCILDPIVQVHEQGVTFEVFSKDEGCYAQLTFHHQLFDNVDNVVYGTTNIDYSSTLLQGIEQIRSYRTTHLDIGHEAIALQTLKETTNDTLEVIEKRINVPKTWIRSLLQVQSAIQLSQDTFSLDPVALYNILFELRMKADIKGKKRGLVIELSPNKYPTLMLEPFDTVIQSNSQPYQGKIAKVIRLWGRRRLALLKKVFPYTKHIEVSLLGQGMPSYWHLRGEGFHLTFAMTGFSQANWSQALNFDLLLPKRPDGQTNNQSTSASLLEALQQKPCSLKTLAKQLTLTPAQLRPLLLQLAQQGFIRYDATQQLYYYRPLTDEPLAMQDFAYSNLAQKHAYDIASRPNAISNFLVHIVPSKGVDICADIEVSEDRRSYHSKLQLNEEGMVSHAECSCPQFLQHRLMQGACSHLIALRIAYAHYDAKKDPKQRWQETRLFSKRLKQQPQTTSNHRQIEQIQITLNQKKVIIERIGGKKAGRQQFVFNQPQTAHRAFLTHIAHIQATGFLENQVI